MSGLVTWVISEGTPNGAERAGLVAAVRAAGCRLVEARVVPFAAQFDGPAPDVEGPVICYGVTGLLAAARQAGWAPAGWEGRGLGLSALIDAIPDLAWNGGARFRPLRSLREETAELMDTVFVRPEDADKAFAGTLHDRASMTAWLDGLDRAEWGGGADPVFALCPPRLPAREWRCWIVDGRVVAGCRYAVAGRAEPEPGVPARVAAVVRTALIKHDPLPAYVLDIGEDEDGLGVIELNSVNSAGFYVAEPAPIVAALTDLVRRSPP